VTFTKAKFAWSPLWFLISKVFRTRKRHRLLNDFILFLFPSKKYTETLKLTNKFHETSTLENALEHRDTDAQKTISQKSRFLTLNVLALTFPSERA